MSETPETDELMIEMDMPPLDECSNEWVTLDEHALSMERQRNLWRSVAEQAEKALEQSRILIDGHIEDAANPMCGVKWLVKAKMTITAALSAFDSLRKEREGE